MSKTKKYLMLASGILLALWGAACAYFALSYIIDVASVNEITNWISGNMGDLSYDTAQTVARFLVAFIASSAIVSLAFAGFTLRFTFYTPAQYEDKRSIAITMAALAFVVVNPIIAGLFLAAALIRDDNYVAPAPTVAVDSLEEKLQKLAVLKEKNLISEEEYNKLRTNILNAGK